MEYTRLGRSGLRISRIALGCLSFGRGTGSYGWVLDDDLAEPIFRQAVESGITLWDTANVYAGGTSEESVGRAVRRYTRREDVVLATKVHFPMGTGPGESGLSRRAILEQVDGSLRRLNTDYIDLYQIHRFDPLTPMEETVEALHDLVKQGKVRYLGASSMPAWRFAEFDRVAERGGWTRFISMQDQYNLTQREEEREMFGLLEHLGVNTIPWSPLAKGLLARPAGEGSARFTAYDGPSFRADGDDEIVGAVQRVAESRGVPMAQIALAWVLANPIVAAPLVGATKPHHLADAVAALDITLTPEEKAALESPYSPREPTAY